MSLTRRYFLKIAAAAGASAALKQTVFAQNAPQSNSPNERLKVAVIGCGGRGGNHIDALAARSDVDLAVLCDTNTETMATKAAALAGRDRPQPQLVQDYRRVLDDPSIDFISTASPNHWHALMAIHGLQAGKHVYSEKPISHNVWEGRQIVKWADKLGKLCQCGTQSRSSPALQAAYKFVHEAKGIGAVKYAIGNCYKPRRSIGKRAQPLPIPTSLDYDLWCGPAAKVDIFRDRFDYDWHWDFNTGNGDTGNQGIHQMDVARWFLKEPALSPRVMSIGGRLGYDDAGNTPNTLIIYHAYEKAPLIFETRGLPKRGLDWSTGMDEFRNSQIGAIVQGETGYVVLTADYSFATAYNNDNEVIQKWEAATLLPDERKPAAGQTYEPTADHFANFIAAVRAGDRKLLNADCLEGHVSSALCHLGNISYQIGGNLQDAQIRQLVKDDPLWADSYDRMAKHLEANGIAVNNPKVSVGPWLNFDPAAERFTNNEAANALLSRDYRANYMVPDASA